MDAPLSTDRIAAVFASARSPSDLYESLSRYEGDALLLSSSKQSDNSELLSYFYSTFFFAHLLTDQMYAQVNPFSYRPLKMCVVAGQLTYLCSPSNQIRSSCVDTTNAL